MAQIIPDEIDAAARRGHAARELETLEMLERELSGEYTVYHGVHWARADARAALYGEIDFIVANRLGRLVERDADDDEPAAAVLLLERLEFWGLGATGRAPGGPEVDDDDLAPKRGEIELLPVEVDEAQGGGRGADLRHARSLCPGREGEEREAREEVAESPETAGPPSHGFPRPRDGPFRPSPGRSSSGCRGRGRR